MTLERISSFTGTFAGKPMIDFTTALLPVPAVTDGFRYARENWSGTVRNLLVKHRLDAAALRPKAAEVQISPALRERWHQLFGTAATSSQAHLPVPFLYNQSVGTLLYTKMFSDLGINFRYLLHVQHQTTHYVPVDEWTNANDQELHCSSRGIWRLGHGKAIVMLRVAIHRVRRDGGELLATANDRFLIRNVPKADLKKLESGRPMLRSVSDLRRRTLELSPESAHAMNSEIVLSRDMGKQFGQVSGDYNPVHTTPLAARLFGIKRTFLQGLGLRNAVARELVRAGSPLNRFQMSFTKPAYLEQTMRFTMVGERFEVVDEEGEVVTFGSTSDAQ